MLRLRVLTVLALVVLAAACTLPLSTPGSTTAIQFVSTSTTDGWKYDYYRNTAYPCAISGYQTFVIGTKVGSSNTDAAAVVGVHARRRRGLLRRERQPAARPRARSPKSR